MNTIRCSCGGEIRQMFMINEAWDLYVHLFPEAERVQKFVPTADRPLEHFLARIHGGEAGIL